VQGAKSPLSVAANDPAIEAQDITFAGNGTTIRAYQARPRSASGALPVVLVCHENQGLTDHIRDMTRRFAKEGYLACAVDLLSREGGTAAVTDTARIPGLLSNYPPAQMAGDFKAAVDFYKGQSSLARGDRIGLTGYCFGGGIVWVAATTIPDLKAAVPYYGPPPPVDQVPNIKAAMFGVYTDDPRDFANNGRDQLEAALKAANITYQFKIYPGTQHAFNNDTAARWNQEQSLAAWQDTLAWFGRYLKA
jgi:carboxymethylenebutenolidase